MPKEACPTCKVEYDWDIIPFTHCSKCDKTFCCDLKANCFVKHLAECRGIALSVLNPAWTVNLRKPKEKGN